MSRLDAAVPIFASIGVMTCPSDTDLFRNAIQDCARFCHNVAANGMLPMPPGSEHDGAAFFPGHSSPEARASRRKCNATARSRAGESVEGTCYAAAG